MTVRVLILAVTGATLILLCALGVSASGVLSDDQMRDVWGGCPGGCHTAVLCGSDYCDTDFCGGYCMGGTLFTYKCQGAYWPWMWCGIIVVEWNGCGYESMMGVCDKQAHKCNNDPWFEDECPNTVPWEGSYGCE